MNGTYFICALAFGLLVGGQANAMSELEQRAEVAAATERNFLANDFKRLERISTQYRTKKSRSSSGLWMLTLFYSGIEEFIKNQTRGQDPDASFAVIEEKTKKWIQDYPESPTAHIAHGLALLERAWAYRGGGYASTVKPESWAQFRQSIDKARTYLESSKVVASVDPKWYECMMVIARTQDWDRRDFDALLKEALEREPLFYQTYFSALEYLLPKWHGDIRQIEAFAQDAVIWTKEEEGLGMYARLYWYASQSQFKNDLFNNSLVDWPQMKQGFEDVISRYPDPWNLNNFARFACLARDKPKTLVLLKRIEPMVVREAWVPVSLKQQCADWALPS